MSKSNKMSIEWHEKNLKNRREGLLYSIKERERITKEIEVKRQEIDLLERQIIEAKKRGMVSFDNERLLKRRTNG